MKIYISHPITALPEPIYTMGIDSAIRLIKLAGHEPINPLELTAHLTDKSHDNCMEICRIAVKGSDAFLVATNSDTFNRSKGCTEELEIAKTQGIKILILSDMYMMVCENILKITSDVLDMDINYIKSKSQNRKIKDGKLEVVDVRKIYCVASFTLLGNKQSEVIADVINHHRCTAYHNYKGHDELFKTDPLYRNEFMKVWRKIETSIQYHAVQE